MTPERQRLAESIFKEALLVDVAGRGAMIGARCGSDVELLGEVASLLSCVEEPEGPLDAAAVLPVPGSSIGGTVGSPVFERAALPASGRIGQYRLTSVLGAGGMGVVYVGEQDRPRRTVAIKVLRAELATRSMLERFEFEAEVLGRLKHPGIAQIIEAGTTDLGAGPQPFFAMELVNGPTLTAYADRETLGVRARLGLFLRLCDAAEHAHRRGVIHRDLKPANILVDESGQPRILDFGIARAAGRDDAPTMLRTAAGQIVGTLPYMSPEQVVGDPEQVDTGTDVYALGVILYELLAGRTPHDLAGRSIPEAVRIIRDAAPPRLGQLRRSLRGDIETIVHKAIDADRTRRYSSAAALGGDVKRFLDGLPIDAKRDSTFYVLSKQIRRHRVPVAAALVVLASLVFVAVLLIVQGRTTARLAQDRLHALELADEERMVSNIERGRMAARLPGGGGIGMAEPLLWKEALRRPDDPRPAWALWEMYAAAPCIAARRAGARADYGPIAAEDMGRFIAVGRTDGAVELMDPSLATSLRVLQGDTAPVSNIAISRGGPGRVGILAAAHDSGRVSLWFDPLSDRPAVVFAAHGKLVEAFAVSPDGSRLATSGFDMVASLWDIGNGAATRIASLGEKGTRCFGMVFSPDGARVYAAGFDSTPRCFSASDGTPIELPTFECPPGRYESLTVTPDGGTLVSCFLRDDDSPAYELRANRVDTGACTGHAELNGVLADGLAVSRGGVVATGGSSLSMWTLPDLAPSYEFTRDPGSPLGAAWLEHEGGAPTLLSVDRGGEVRAWEPEPFRARVELPSGRYAMSAEFSANGQTLVVLGGVEGVLRVVDVPSGMVIKEIDVSAFNPAGMNLVLSPDARTCTLIDHVRSAAMRVDLVAGRMDPVPVRQARSRGDDARMLRVATSPDGRWLAMNSRSGGVELFAAEDLDTPVGFFPIEEYTSDLCFSPDGATLLVVPYGGGGRIVSVPELKELGRLPESLYCTAGTFLSDGLSVASGGRLPLTIFGLDGAVRRECIGHSGQILSVAASRDGRYLATCGRDATVRLWDARTGQSLAVLEHGLLLPRAVKFSPDSSHLLVLSAKFLLWDLRYYQRHLARNLEYHLSELEPGQARPSEALLRANPMWSMPAAVAP